MELISTFCWFLKKKGNALFLLQRLRPEKKSCVKEVPKLNTLPWEQQNSTQMPTRHEIDEQTCLTDHYEFPNSGFFMNSHLKKQPPRIICNINRAIMLV